MGLPRVIIFQAGRIVTGLISVFGLSFDVTGASVFQISAGNWGLIALVAFVLFILATLSREIELAIQQKPKITVMATVAITPNEYLAKLEIHNSGASATFTVKARVTKGFVQPVLYNMQWESFPNIPNCLINHDGYESIVVGEISPKAYASSDPSYPIYRNGIMLHRVNGNIGVSNPEIINKYMQKERYPTMFQGINMPKDSCIVKVMITSEPSPLKDYGVRYFALEIDHEHGHKLLFKELSESEIDKEGS